jgi:hypothetical protein
MIVCCVFLRVLLLLYCLFTQLKQLLLDYMSMHVLLLLYCLYSQLAAACAACRCTS